MRGSGRGLAVLSCLMLFAAGCTLGNGTNRTASDTPIPPSPSLLPVSSPIAAASPTSQPTSTAPAANGLAVTSIPTHNGEVGVIYLAVTLGATGGTAPYTWAATGMPAGLTVSPQGVVTGNNTAAGKFSFTVTVTDSTGATATGTQNMTVFPALAVTQPCAQVCNVSVGCTFCGRFGTVSGGAGPYHYKQVGGVVPDGMTLNGFALQGPFPAPLALGCVCDVLVAGPPITRIPWTLSASVTDDFGVTKTVAANFSEFFPVGILCTTANPCTCSNGSNNCSSIAAYEFGSPSDNFTVQVVQTCTTTNPLASPPAVTCVAGMPANWSATAKGGLINLILDPNNGFTGTVTIDLVDHGGCVAPLAAVSKTMDLTVNWPGP